MVRGIRGATTVDNNTEEDIFKETGALLRAIITENEINRDDMVAITFTATGDIDRAYPAKAARMMGFTDVPLMCLNEMNVPGSLEMCLRVLVLFNTHKNNSQLRHVYLKGAKALRPDLVNQ